MQEVFSSSVRGLPAPPQQDQEQPIELEQLQQQVPSRENEQSQSQGQEQVQHVQGPSESRTFPAMVVSSCESPPSSAPSLQRIRTVIAADEPGYLGPVAVIKDVLQPHDLALVLEELEAQSEGFSSSSRSKHYRNTDRTLLRSSATAERLWLAVSHYFQKQLGPVVVPQGSTGVGRVFPYGSEGTWLAVGVSPVFRVNKYGPGQHFGPHYDGFNLLENGRRTFFTLVTYLETTTEEHGGATNFLRHDTPMGPNSDGLHMASANNIVASVQPIAGSGVIFHHHTKHEGQRLTGGSKLILNCDVLFERVPGSERPLRQSEIDAAALFAEAEKFESRGDFEEAVNLYKAVRRTDAEFAQEHGV